MASRWWNHNYSFRRKLTFTNVDQTLPAGHVMSFNVPQSLIEQGKFVPEDRNLAVVFFHKSIAKVINARITQDLDGNYMVFFPTFVTIQPNTVSEDYYLYYGADHDHLVVENDWVVPGNPPVYRVVLKELDSGESISYTNPSEDWRFVQMSSTETYAASVVPGAKLALNFYAEEIKFDFISYWNTGILEAQVDESDWIEIDTVSEDGSLQKKSVIFTDLDDSLHTLRIVNKGEYRPNYLIGELATPDQATPITATPDTATPDTATPSTNSMLDEFLEEHYRRGAIVIQSIEYDRYHRAVVQVEEADESLPWNSKIGGVINVG